MSLGALAQLLAAVSQRVPLFLLLNRNFFFRLLQSRLLPCNSGVQKWKIYLDLWLCRRTLRSVCCE